MCRALMWPKPRIFSGNRASATAVERKILADYEALIDEIVTRLTPRNHATAVALARVPEKIRGFGHIKARHIALAQAEEARLLLEFRATEAPAKAAAE